MVQQTSALKRCRDGIKSSQNEQTELFYMTVNQYKESNTINQMKCYYEERPFRMIIINVISGLVIQTKILIENKTFLLQWKYCGVLQKNAKHNSTPSQEMVNILQKRK